MAATPETSSRRSWSLDALNEAPGDERLRADLTACCAATRWVEALLSGRPFRTEEALFAASDAATGGLDDTGLAEALAAHPRIGEGPRVPVQSTTSDGDWSRQEQSGVSSASERIRTELAAANVEYEQRFGQVYLVCATGKSADELLAVCRARLGNDPATERRIMLAELAKINRIRLGKLLHPERSS